MIDIVKIAKAELEKLNNVPDKNHLKTGDIRRLSGKLFREVKASSKDYIYYVCEEFLRQNSWPMGAIAFDFAYRMKNQYDEKTFSIFERWLMEYVRGWGDCDDFCLHAFGGLICQKPELISNIIAWTTQDGFWVRRASAVILIPAIRRDKYKKINPLQISDIIMQDSHVLVCKGYGWMLKILSTKEPRLVFEYLVENKNLMPRVAFRYALEKLDADKKQILMQ